MLSSDLRSRTERLEREQRKRLEDEKRKEEKERILEQRARLRRQKEEDAKSLKRAAALAEAELERLQHEEDLEHNNGVWWQKTLQADIVDESKIWEKGIKRGADKVILPASASDELMSQDAPKNGAMFFQLRASNGNVTHSGVLGFSGLDGKVQVPRQLAQTLWPSQTENKADNKIIVTYCRLEKGLFARFQPETADFQKEVGDRMEEVLVAALSQRSVLSQGDWLKVDFNGKEYSLRVQQLKPAPQVSVIDTEMEADIEPSIETEQRLAKEEEDKRRREKELEKLAQEDAARKLNLEAKAEAERLQAERLAAQEAERLAQIRQEKEAMLPPEPSADSPSVSCLIRFPDGSRHMRRFRREDSVSLLFTFVDAKGGGGIAPEQYKLVSQFPKRQIDNHCAKSLLEVGLSSSQEVLMLEPISAH